MKGVHIIRYIYCLIIYIYTLLCARLMNVDNNMPCILWCVWLMRSCRFIIHVQVTIFHWSACCIYAIGSPKTPASLIRSPTIDFLYASDYISVPLVKSTVNPPSPTHFANWHRWMTSVGWPSRHANVSRTWDHIHPVVRSWSPGHVSGCLSWRYPWA